MLQAIKLPACIRNLHARLSDVDLYNLALAAHVAPVFNSATAAL